MLFVTAAAITAAGGIIRAGAMPIAGRLTTLAQREPPGPWEPARGTVKDKAAQEAGLWSSAGSQQNC